jgi:DHA1 family multidrug resistance protein-like MFS transporter
MTGWKRNLVILGIGQFLVLGAMSMIMPFLPLYIQELGVTDEESVLMWAGIIFGANFLSLSIFSPIWGRLADRYGRKMMVLRSGFGMAIVIILMGFATDVWHLLGLRLLNGIIAGFIPAGIALMASNTPKERVGYALGVLHSCAISGAIMGPFFGGLLAEWVGFSIIFFITGTVVFIASFVVLFMVKEEFVPNPKMQTKSLWTDFQSVAQHKPILTLFTVSFMIQFAALSALPLLPIFVQSLLGSGQMVAFFAGVVTATTGVANMLSSPILGKKGDRIGSDRILFYSMIGAALFFLPHAFVTEVWQLIVLRFLLGLCLGGMLPSVQALVRHYTPNGLESRAYGFNTSAVALGNMCGPIFGGFMAGVIGIRGVFIVMFFMLLANAVWVRLRITGYQPIEKRTETSK